MNIKDAYIHNGEAILKDIQVSGSKLQKLKAGKDDNDAYLTWVDVLDFSSFGASGHSHTWIGDGTLKMYAHNNNEINFGGTNTGTKIYFGYRATDSRAIPTEFVFGGSSGSAQLTASKIAAGLLTLTSTESSATSTSKGINFTNGSSTAHIGLSTLLGIYSSGNIILRPDGAAADATGNGSLKLTKDGATLYETLTAEKLVKSGGTSTQFLKADGSVDSNSYSLSTHNHDSSYVTLTTDQTITGVKTFKGSTPQTEGDTVRMAVKLNLNTYSDSAHNVAAIGFANEANTTQWFKGFIGYERTGSYDRGKFVIGLNNTAASGSATYDDIVASIDATGNITATTFTGTLAGNASSADSVPWTGITGKPETFPVATHDHDDVYLKLSGGTLTGDLTLKVNSGDSPKIIFQRGTLTDSLDDWRIFDTGGNLKFQHTTGSTTTWKDYVVFSATAGTVTINGNTVWHAGNDGSGSTLDADTLDGFHAADFRNNIVDLRTSPQTFNPTYLKDIVFISEADYTSLVSNGSITKNSITHTYNSSNWYVIPDKVPEYAETAGSVAWSNVTSKPATATRWPSWSEVTGKPSTFTPSSHTHYATRYKDSRNTAMTPTNAVAVDGLAIDFKTKANGVNAGSGLYCGLVTMDPYSDVSGGYPMQMGFNTGADANNTNELYIRTAKDANTWNEWRTVITSATIGSQSVGSAITSTYASNVGAAGTAGTNYVTAAKVIATCNWYDTMTSNTDDANDVIDRWSEIVAFVANFAETPDLATFLSNNYLAKSGGTMTGPIKWTDSTALPEQTSPQYFLCIDAFNSGGTTKWASKANTLKALTGLTSTAVGDSDEPVYWDGSKFVKAGAYPTKASWNYDDVYLKLTGGTLTSSSNPTLSIKSTASGTSEVGIRFYRNTTEKAWIGYHDTYGVYLYNKARGKYLNYKDDGTLQFEGNTIWHAGNDGSGSTLDADLLDGKHASEFSLSSHTHAFVDLSSHPTTLDGYGITDAVPKIKNAASAVLNVNSMFDWDGVEITTPFRWSSNNPDMFAFTVRMYNGYHYTDIVISGYCYGSSKWYLPKAEIIGGTQTYVVKFGWHNTARSESDTNKYLYVWIGRGKNANNEIIKFSYGGLSIFNVHTGHSTNLDMYKNWSAVNKSEDNLVNVQSTVNTVLPNEWSNILNKPTSFTPAAHTHYIGTTATQSSSAAQNLTGISDSTFSGVMNITGKQDNYTQGIRIHDAAASGTHAISSIWLRAGADSGFTAGMQGITADSTGMRFRLAASASGTTPTDYLTIAYGGAVTVASKFTASSSVYFTGLTEGTSDPTDSTEILTSYASNNGFDDTTGAGQVYRRKASTLYNYIKGKTDNLYVKLSSTEQTIESTISSFSKGIVEFYRSSGDHIAFITFSNKANNAKRVLGSIGFHSGGVGKLQYRSADAKFYDIINGSNITTYVACASSTITLSTSEQTLLTVKSGESGSLSSSTIKVKLPTTSPYSYSFDDVTGKPTWVTWSETSSTATYSLSNATWTQTITLPTAAGSYILKLVSGNSTLTGVFSIGASDNAKDEISLHLHGNGPRLYARTNGTKLELSRNIATATNTSVTITYRRMI